MLLACPTGHQWGLLEALGEKKTLQKVKYFSSTVSWGPSVPWQSFWAVSSCLKHLHLSWKRDSFTALTSSRCPTTLLPSVTCSWASGSYTQVPFVTW